MGPNGEAQYYATDLADAYRILYEHYRYSYVVPGEARPRGARDGDAERAPIADHPVPAARRLRDASARSSTTPRTRAASGRSRCAR